MKLFFYFHFWTPGGLIDVQIITYSSLWIVSSVCVHHCLCVYVCVCVYLYLCVNSISMIVCYLLFPLSNSNLHSSDTALLFISLTPGSQFESSWLNLTHTHTHIHTHTHTRTHFVSCSLRKGVDISSLCKQLEDGTRMLNWNEAGVSSCELRTLLSVRNSSESWCLLTLTGHHTATVMAHHSAYTSQQLEARQRHSHCSIINIYTAPELFIWGIWAVLKNNRSEHWFCMIWQV